jgi:hypothetical protein
MSEPLFLDIAEAPLFQVYFHKKLKYCFKFSEANLELIILQVFNLQNVKRFSAEPNYCKITSFSERTKNLPTRTGKVFSLAQLGIVLR